MIRTVCEACGADIDGRHGRRFCLPCRVARDRGASRASAARWARKNPERRAVHVRETAIRRAVPERARMERRRGTRRAFLVRWKLAAGCFDCGYAGHPAALDFDHVQGTKNFNIATSALRSWAAVLAEIAKCVVRCANCHRIATLKRRTA